jgi:hypothetical protein
MFRITAQPAWLDELDPEAQGRLSRNNEKLVKGQSDDYQSPAMNHVTDDQITDFVEKTFESGGYSEYLIGVEKANLSKLGPRSIAKPWEERRASLEEYFTSEMILSESDFRENVRELIDSRTIPRDHAHRYRPVSVDHAVKHLKASTAGGLPYMQKKGILRKEGKATLEHTGVYPCVIYTRTQEGGKTRNVMGVGISDVIQEMLYHQAFLPVEKTLGWRKALVSPTAVDESLSALINARNNDQSIVSLDFSSFDASVTPAISGRAFAFIAGFFQERYLGEIYDIYSRFATIPFYTPDGEYHGNHGVPSGSAFTNTVDSIAQYLVAKDFGIPLEFAQIQGDDGVYLIGNEYVESFTEHFGGSGFTVNTDKTDVFQGDEATYLQRYYHSSYRDSFNRYTGVYSIARALLRLKYLEKFVQDIGVEEELSGHAYFALRTITILENCKHHPHFHDLIDFVRSHDKTGLRVEATNIRAFEEHDSRKSRTSEVTNQYGDEGGIESFATWQYLRSS